MEHLPFEQKRNTSVEQRLHHLLKRNLQNYINEKILTDEQKVFVITFLELVRFFKKKNISIDTKEQIHTMLHTVVAQDFLAYFQRTYATPTPLYTIPQDSINFILTYVYVISYITDDYLRTSDKHTLPDLLAYTYALLTTAHDLGLIKSKCSYKDLYPPPYARKIKNLCTSKQSIEEIQKLMQSKKGAKKLLRKYQTLLGLYVNKKPPFVQT